MSKTFVQGVSIKTISDLGFDYQPKMDLSNNKAAKISQLYVKKKILDPKEDIRMRTQTMLRSTQAKKDDIDTNRFFDTFTKFSHIKE